MKMSLLITLINLFATTLFVPTAPLRFRLSPPRNIVISPFVLFDMCLETVANFDVGMFVRYIR